MGRAFLPPRRPLSPPRPRVAELPAAFLVEAADFGWDLGWLFNGLSRGLEEVVRGYNRKTYAIRSLRPLGGGIAAARRASRMMSTCRMSVIRPHSSRSFTHLHGSVVNKYAVESLYGLGSSIAAGKPDVGHTTADTSRAI